MKTIIRDVLIVGLAAPIVLFIVSMVAPHAFDPLETASYDLRMKTSPLAAAYLSPIIIVDIDDKTINELGDPELWPRTYLAQIIDYLGNARMIGLYLPLYNSDYISSEQIGFYAENYGSAIARRLRLPEARGSEIITSVLSSVTMDPQLASALRRSDRVFLAYWATEGRTGGGPLPFPVYNTGRTAEGYVKLPLEIIKHSQFLTPIESFSKTAKGMGFGEFSPDPDGRIRTQPLMIQGKDALYPSFALAMAMSDMGAFNQIEVVTGELLKVKNASLTVEAGARLRYLKPNTRLKTVSFLDVFQRIIALDEFKDKVVFIGSSSVNFGPLPPDGVREQAVIFANIINGFSVTRSPRAVSFFLTMLFGVGMAFVILRYRPVLGIPAAVAGPGLYLVICFLSCQSGRVWIELVSPITSLALVAVTGFVLKSATEGRGNRRLVAVLENRVPPAVLKKLVRQSSDLLTLKPVTLTLARAEIKNLSPLIPQYPEIANQVLEEFTTTMAGVVFAHGGIVASYIPGGLVASFGAPLVLENHALMAAKAAVEMRRKFSIIGARLQAEGRGFLELGVVLETAEVLIGFLKPTQDYQVLGPALALVDNLAALNRRLKTTILATQHTQDLLKEQARFRVVLESGIAGPTGPVRVYELLRVGT